MRIFALIATVLALSVASFSFASAQEKSPVYLMPGSDVAVGGYDAVSFFDGDAQRGDSGFTARYNGATWHFISAENRDRFMADPASFAPQYGGYCAWAVSEGYLAKGDPRYAQIVAGKLYLNFNMNIQAKWSRDIPGHIARANENWPAVLER
ncbi:MAG: YHS domain-containing (seleno)protein [Pseudomonadota bacterium]